MNDALLVRGFERLGNLLRNRQRLIERHRAVRDAIGQRWSLDQLHDQPAHAIGLLEAIHVRDVGVIQRGKCPGLALESGETFLVVHEGVRQHLDRDVATQARISRAIDLPHPASAEKREDFVGPEARARR